MLALCLVALAADPNPESFSATHVIEVPLKIPNRDTFALELTQGSSHPRKLLGTPEFQARVDEEYQPKLAAALSAAAERAFREAGQLTLRETLAARSAGLGVGNSLMAADILAGHADRYQVTNVQVAQEHNDKGRAWITVKTELDLSALDAELADIKRKMKLLGSRTVLLAINEVTIGPTGQPIVEGATRAISTALFTMLQLDGWTVLDGAGRYASASPGREEIDRVARQLGADHVLQGTATMTQLAPGNGVLPEVIHGEQVIFRVKGEYALELVELGTKVSRARVAGILDPAKENRINLSLSYRSSESSFAELTMPAVAGSLRDQMLLVLDAREKDGNPIEVVVSGVDPGQVSALEKTLKALKTVKGVSRRGAFADQTQTLEVRCVGTASDLATAITKAKGQRLPVTRVKKNRIELGPPQ